MTRQIFIAVLSLAIGVAMVGTVCALEPPENQVNTSSLMIWEDTPVDPTLVPQRDVGLVHKKGNEKIQWDVWGLPIGNGRLGAVFYGNVENELVQFNEDSLWTGRDANIIVKKVGANKPDNINYGSYQPFGDIHIMLPHSEYTDYRRELDIRWSCPRKLVQVL